MFCFYNNSFLFFGSGTPHRLLGLQKTKDAQGKPTRRFNKKFRNVLGQDFLQRLWIFCLFVLLQFFVFGSGSLHRLLGLGLQKTQKHLRKTKRTKKQFKMFGPRTFFRGLKFLLSLFFVLLDPGDVFIGY